LIGKKAGFFLIRPVAKLVLHGEAMKEKVLDAY
jgi:hypothetical protein